MVAMAGEQKFFWFFFFKKRTFLPSLRLEHSADKKGYAGGSEDAAGVKGGEPKKAGAHQW